MRWTMCSVDRTAGLNDPLARPLTATMQKLRLYSALAGGGAGSGAGGVWVGTAAVARDAGAGSSPRGFSCGLKKAAMPLVACSLAVGFGAAGVGMVRVKAGRAVSEPGLTAALK